MSNEVATYLAPADTMEVFVEAVKARMKRDGITQVQLAAKLGVTQATVGQRLRKEGGNCSFKTADEMAIALGTTTIELLNSVHYR